MQRSLLWYKSFQGLGDRIHHIVQMMEVAERFDADFIVDMRDGMFGEVGEDVFSRWFECPHARWIAHPDFDGLLTANPEHLQPPRREVFEQLTLKDVSWRFVYPWQRWIFKKKHPWVVQPWVRFLRIKWMWLVRPNHLREEGSGKFVAPVAHRISLHPERPKVQFYADTIRKPAWSAVRMVWPNTSLREAIASNWKSVGFEPGEAIGIHVRQTDKSSSDRWRQTLADLVEGRRGEGVRQVFLATDSIDVLNAFRHAGLKQRLFWNPWLPLPDEAVPLHLSGFDGEAVLKSAVYDLWTLAHCCEFQDWPHSSFSRVAMAWRRFLPSLGINELAQGPQ